ncbi:hypothetical protein IPZ58_34510 [Streptomyces roseoverticillatus]|uniref:hypothetical protein n=1 Tax=Streptomyces roseoverticillatus TaxID=66429 RepID=UPI001F234E7B|nr:hypothetical protein [Streptomyces roseoverticillatus]MCF3106642.1 hypothetical protein [Streptomyces roseoverticillatus]
MAFTTTTRGPAGPHRRRVLAGGAAALLSAAGGGLLTGCSGGTGAPSDASGRSGDERLRAAAGRASLDLLARYDATLAVHGGLAERLRPLRGEVARHAEAFGAARGAPDSSSPSPSSLSPSPPSSSPPGPSPADSSPPAGSSSPPRADGVPGDEKAALAALADAERRTADSRTKDLGSASPELARLLASVAAAGAAHAYLLGSDS